MANGARPAHNGAHTHSHTHKKPDPDRATVAIEFNGRVCVVSEGHLFEKNSKGQWEETVIPVDEDYPDGCSHDFECHAHHDGSICGDHCGHLSVPHGDHIDHLVPVGDDAFELHHPHGDHCDYHGTVKRVKLPLKGPAP